MLPWKTPFILSGIMMIMIAACPAWATIIPVDTLADNMTVDGQVTLREALEAAVNDISVDGSPAGNGHDTIVFRPALDGGTINWTQGDYIIFSGGDITITAANLSSGLTIDCQGNSRFLHAQGGPNLAFINLTLTGGQTSAPTSNGGAVSIFGGEATFTDCTLRGNAAVGDGGAVVGSSATTLRFFDCILEDNTADGSGGAIYYASSTGDTLVVERTHIRRNTGSSGGGIYINNGLAVFTDAFVDSNTASSTTTLSSIGGAIFSEGTLEMTRTSVTGNRAVPGASSNGFTGGIYIVGADAAFTQCTFSGNSADAVTSGCTLYNAYSSAGSGTTTVTDCTFDGNTGGPGSAATNSGTMILTNCTIQNNDSSGGAPLNNSISGAVMDIIDCTFTGNSGEGGGALSNATGCDMTITNSLFDSNSTTADGGALLNLGTLTADLCTFRANTALTGEGGAVIHRNGALTLSRSTFDANQADRGGALFTQNTTGGTSHTESSTFKNNVALTDGGGIFVQGDMELFQCTITGNSAGQNGGGIHHGDGYPANSGTATIKQCTIVGNTATLEGGGIMKKAPMTIGGTIVSGNTAFTAIADFDNFSNPLTSLGYNLIGENNGVTWNATDQLGVLDPMVGPLQDNGGPTETMALLVGSPALDGSSATIYALFPYDQRGSGFPRALDGTQQGIATGDIGAFEFDPACTQLVTSLTDSNLPGHLRYEIACAAPGDTIRFDPALSGGTFLMTAGQITIDKDLVIEGTGLGITLDAQGSSRVLEVLGGANVDLWGLILTGGAAGDGGGIMNWGDLSLYQCTVTGNTATDTGGGAASYGGGVLVLYESQVYGNSATNNGGGLYCNGSTSAILINYSTVANNSAGLGGGCFSTTGSSISCSFSTISGNQASTGGGIYNSGNGGSTISVIRSTVSGNQATGNTGGGVYTSGGASFTLATLAGNVAATQGGAIYDTGSSLHLGQSTLSLNSANEGGGLYTKGFPPYVESCIVSANTAVSGNADIQVDQTTTVTSGGYNLIGDTNTGVFTQAGDMTGILDPRLGPLQDNGGPTETMALLLGSQAIDAGDPTACATYSEDQRGAGFPRAIDGDGDGGSACDIGAFETELRVFGIPVNNVDVAVTLGFNNYTGAGFSADPSAGQLDSDGIIVQGVSDETVPMRFGDSATSGDYARGPSAGGVQVGGVYAFNPAGSPALGFSPSPTDLTPGFFVFGYRNLTGVPVTSLTVSYDLAVFNNGDRSNGVNLAYAESPTVEIDPALLTFSTISGSTFFSPETADPAPAWSVTPFTLSLGGLTVPPNGCIYLKLNCADVAGANSGRDDFALDNLALTANPSGLSDVEVPVAFAGPYRLGRIYPNPFNPRASFDLEVKRDQHVRVTVYDVSGRAVRTLHDGMVAAGGIRTFVLDGADLGSGVYFVRAEGQDFTAVRKAVILK